MFVGRAAELEQIRRAIASDRAELGVVYGRRRVGKSTLLEEASPPSGALLFEGLQQGGLRAQVEHFADQLAQQTRSAPVRATNWKDASDALSPHLARGRHYVVFDEFPWMASGQTQLISLLKFYWDRVWKKNPRLHGARSSARRATTVSAGVIWAEPRRVLGERPSRRADAEGRHLSLERHLGFERDTAGFQRAMALRACGRRMTPTATTTNAQNQAAGSPSAPVLRFEVPLLLLPGGAAPARRRRHRDERARPR